MSNILYVHKEGDKIIIDKWIQPPASGGAILAQQQYMIFWGPRELLITRAKVYRFLRKDLPSNIKEAIDGASPIPDDEARGIEPVEAPPKPVEAPPKPVEEPPKPVEAPPKPVEAPAVVATSEQAANIGAPNLGTL